MKILHVCIVPEDWLTVHYPDERKYLYLQMRVIAELVNIQGEQPDFTCASIHITRNVISWEGSLKRLDAMILFCDGDEMLNITDWLYEINIRRGEDYLDMKSKKEK